MRSRRERVTPANQGLQKMIVYHGTSQHFASYDKSKPSASPSAAIHPDAIFLTASLPHAWGYAGDSASANVRQHDLNVDGAWAIDAEGMAWRDTHPLMVAAMVGKWSRQKLASEVRDYYRWRLLAIASGEANANIGAWIGMRRRQREWSPGRKQGRCLVNRRNGKWGRGTGYLTRELVNRHKRVFRAMIAGYQPGATCAIIHNSGDSPILSERCSEETGKPHTVVIVTDQTRLSPANIIKKPER